MEELWIVMASSTGSVALLSIVGWLSRDWISNRLKSAIQHEYDCKLEVYKSQIKSESDVTLERIKNALKAAADSKAIRLGKTFERVAESIATTYEKLVVFMDSVEDYMKMMEWPSDLPKKERRKIVGTRYQEFLEYYRPRRIFFIRNTADKIDNIHKKLSRVAVDFMVRVEGDGEFQSREDPKVWSDLNSFLAKEVPPLLQELERELQSVLGIDQSNLLSMVEGLNSLPALIPKYGEEEICY